MDVPSIWSLIAVAVLLLLTAFFVMAEFSIVKVRSTQLDEYIEGGSRSAVYAKRVVSNLDRYLATCQLGITLTALALGYLAEPAFEKLLYPLIEGLNLNSLWISLISIVLAFIIITFLRVVIGELTPRTLGIQKSERVTIIVARPLIFFHYIFLPFIWLTHSTARLLARGIGLQPFQGHEESHSEEELRLFLADSFKSGEINQSEMMYVNNIFDFDERVAREIMVPRTEMIYFSKEDSFEENLEIVREGQFTRYPVAEEDKDNIIGLVNVKEVFTGQFYDSKPATIEEFIRPIIHVSEATPIKQLLVKMQKERIHMAIVNDEYGGTAGLVTVEDILEEIVGDIRDEFDEDEIPDVEEVDENTIFVSGKLNLDDLNQRLAITLEDEEVDTVGGWFFTNNLDADIGSKVEEQGHEFILTEKDGYQIKRIQINKLA